MRRVLDRCPGDGQCMKHKISRRISMFFFDEELLRVRASMQKRVFVDAVACENLWRVCICTSVEELAILGGQNLF